MKRDPAFLFYSKDWLEGTAELYPNEKGVYIDLLAHQHQKGFLPTDTRRLAKLCGISEEEFLPIWEIIKAKFDQTDNRTVNRRLEHEMFERAEKGKKNTIIGTFASLLRKGKYGSKEYKYLREGFDVNEFKDIDTERLTERLTEWIDKRLKSIEDGDGDENVNESKGLSKKFTPPSIDEVKEYCKERKNNVDAERFINFYESKGWMVGKNKMKDWKAAVRNWESSDKQETKLSTSLKI